MENSRAFPMIDWMHLVAYALASKSESEETLMTTQARRPNVQCHHARPAAEKPVAESRQPDASEEQYRQDYVMFIGKLLSRMTMASLERMLEAALNEIK